MQTVSYSCMPAELSAVAVTSMHTEAVCRQENCLPFNLWPSWRTPLREKRGTMVRTTKGTCNSMLSEDDDNFILRFLHDM